MIKKHQQPAAYVACRKMLTAFHAVSVGDAGYRATGHSREDDVLVVDVLERVGTGENFVELIVIDIYNDEAVVVGHLGEPLQRAAQVLDGALLRQRHLVEGRSTVGVRPHQTNLWYEIQSTAQVTKEHEIPRKRKTCHERMKIYEASGTLSSEQPTPKRHQLFVRKRSGRKVSTRTRFELARAEPIGLAVQRLNHSATSSGTTYRYTDAISTWWCHVYCIWQHHAVLPTPMRRRATFILPPYF